MNRVIGIFLAAAIWSLLLAAMPLPRASAAGCPWNGTKAVVAFQDDGINPDIQKFSEFSNGVRGLIKGPQSNDIVGECADVRSVFIINNNTFLDAVEVGHIHGWGAGCDNHVANYDPAVVFWAVNTLEGQDTECEHAGAGNNFTTPGAWEGYTAADANQDSDWFFAFKGETIGSANMLWTAGLAIANSERKGALDPTNLAHFDNLVRMNRSAVFTSWGNLRRWPPGMGNVALDPNFYCRKIQEDEMKSVQLVGAPVDECPLPADVPPLDDDPS